MAGRFCSHRGHRRQLRRHHRLDLRGRHLKRLREQRHELGGVGPHAAEALQVSLELGEVLGAGQTKRERGDHKREPDYEHGPTAACGSS
jgi:hypothetical protein